MNAKELSPIAIDDTGGYTVRIDYDGSNNPIYIGKADIATVTATPLWQIQKLTYTGSNLTSVTWADGNDSFDNVWDNRASLTYV